MEEHPRGTDCRVYIRNCYRGYETKKNFCQMNRKQLILMLVLVALIGGAGILLVNRQDASWKGNNATIGKKLLGDFPVNDVTQISFKQGTNELHLAKTDIWRVRERNNYPADYKA